jgi:hypothetical protein
LWKSVEKTLKTSSLSDTTGAREGSHSRPHSTDSSAWLIVLISLFNRAASSGISVHCLRFSILEYTIFGRWTGGGTRFIPIWSALQISRSDYTGKPLLNYPPCVVHKILIYNFPKIPDFSVLRILSVVNAVFWRVIIFSDLPMSVNSIFIDASWITKNQSQTCAYWHDLNTFNLLPSLNTRNLKK